MKVIFETKKSSSDGIFDVREMRLEHEVGWDADGHHYMEMFAAFMFARGFQIQTICDVAREYAESNSEEDSEDSEDPTENWGKDAENGSD